MYIERATFVGTSARLNDCTALTNMHSLSDGMLWHNVTRREQLHA